MLRNTFHMRKKQCEADDNNTRQQQILNTSSGLNEIQIFTQAREEYLTK